MENEKGMHPAGRLHNVWEYPGKSTEANITLKAKKGMYPNGSPQVQIDNTIDTFNLKADMEV